MTSPSFRAGLVLLLVAPVLAIDAGCSLLVDTSGLDTEGPLLDSSTHDSGVPSADSSSSAQDSQAAADSTTMDVAAFDGGDSGAPPNTDWCATQNAGYRLCSDFDLPDATIGQGFNLGVSPVPYGEGGSFTFDPSVHTSSPNSGLGVANPFPPGETSGDRLEATLWSLGPTPPSVQCALDWYPRQFSTVAGDYAHVASLTVYTDAQGTVSDVNLSVQMHADGSLVLLEDYTTSAALDATHPIPITVATGQWYAVSMTFTTSGGTTSYAIAVDSVQSAGTVGHASGTLSQPFPASTNVAIAVGPAYYAGGTTAPSPGWIFNYDNVICY